MYRHFVGQDGIFRNIAHFEHLVGPLVAILGAKLVGLGQLDFTLDRLNVLGIGSFEVFAAGDLGDNLGLLGVIEVSLGASGGDLLIDEVVAERGRVKLGHEVTFFHLFAFGQDHDNRGVAFDLVLHILILRAFEVAALHDSHRQLGAGHLVFDDLGRRRLEEAAKNFADVLRRIKEDTADHGDQTAQHHRDLTAALAAA